MGNLSDILAAGGFGGSDFRDGWDSTEAAGDFGPLPAGEYVARVERGELVNVGARATAAYKLTFVVHEGDHAGRCFWQDCWLTRAAMAQAKRDLGKLGVTDPAQLEQPLPPGIIVKVRLALRRDDDGNQRNRVITFDVLRVEKPAADPFAPEGEGVDGAAG